MPCAGEARGRAVMVSAVGGGAGARSVSVQNSGDWVE